MVTLFLLKKIKSYIINLNLHNIGKAQFRTFYLFGNTIPYNFYQTIDCQNNPKNNTVPYDFM